jgi:hypothetical protein
VTWALKREYSGGSATAVDNGMEPAGALLPRAARWGQAARVGAAVVDATTAQR